MTASVRLGDDASQTLSDPQTQAQVVATRDRPVSAIAFLSGSGPRSLGTSQRAGVLPRWPALSDAGPWQAVSRVLIVREGGGQPCHQRMIQNTSPRVFSPVKGRSGRGRTQTVDRHRSWRVGPNLTVPGSSATRRRGRMFGRLMPNSWRRSRCRTKSGAYTRRIIAHEALNRLRRRGPGRNTATPPRVLLGDCPRINSSPHTELCYEECACAAMYILIGGALGRVSLRTKHNRRRMLAPSPDCGLGENSH
mgnify:CR=1 FL=1